MRPQAPTASVRAEQASPGPPEGALWIGAAAALAVVLAAVAAIRLGLGKDGIEAALRLTARLAFLLFWPSYAAGALVILFGPAFAPLKRRGRDFGLAFAAVLAVHLGLVAALCWIGAAPSARIFLIFGPGAVAAALLALCSIARVGGAIGAAGWWALKNLAMNYLLFDFAVDFLRAQPAPAILHRPDYLPFAVLTVAAPALRLLAWLKLRARRAAPAAG
ncbi:MAG: hypothetical protein JWQ97_3327 [Phenylobacterium sp.]|nr:hypothetical protein [Phenylobacterium sp.]